MDRRPLDRYEVVQPSELQWPTLETQKDQSSLLLSLKIYCEAMSSDK